MRGLGQTHGIGQYRIGIKNGGHQAGLVVHQYELGFLVIEQHTIFETTLAKRQVSVMTNQPSVAPPTLGLTLGKSTT
jgi:hypothetical protein